MGLTILSSYGTPCSPELILASPDGHAVFPVRTHGNVYFACTRFCLDVQHKCYLLMDFSLGPSG